MAISLKIKDNSKQVGNKFKKLVCFIKSGCNKNFIATQGILSDSFRIGTTVVVL